ncbi:hypothetical protein F53441_8293 [Fusarium austroafricanum]|uniref:Uncharacterized protein n=1 Tax=Fusarium austroafricanum TaxID=2364996 RepID=A0A8H4NUK3_9HYPO|nr:hypothetical protein F53441_8293 [Fusarium austroafricanum]
MSRSASPHLQGQKKKRTYNQDLPCKKQNVSCQRPLTLSDMRCDESFPLEFEDYISLEAAELTSITQSAPSDTTSSLSLDFSSEIRCELANDLFQVPGQMPTDPTYLSDSQPTQKLAHMLPSESVVSVPVTSCSTYSAIATTASESATETLTANTNTNTQITRAKAEPVAGT